MRMLTAGVFDAFPKLQIILGHYAEGLPFMLDRVDRPYIQGHVKPDPGVAPTLKRLPSEYLRENFLASTSGNYSPYAFECTRAALGAQRMVIGSDYPFEDMDVCTSFLDNQAMSDTERAHLYTGTATSLGMSL
jgi:predicted TIM-barrel fold metal-dependent hydrolase